MLRETRRTHCTPNDICLLHIGKTGGTYLKSILEHNQSVLPESLHILNHRDTVRSTLRKFGAARQIALVFRDPTERFVSGFGSRMRQGRPTYQSIWTPGEAIAYRWFSTPNDLAEALFSDDERLRSAAIFTMESIRHLKRGYQFSLGGLRTLRRQESLIRCCVELKDLDQMLPDVMRSLGVPEFEMPRSPKRHKSQSHASLSDVAVENLHRYWADEYRIYKYLKKIRRT